jgi:signal transduction histidine kinase
MRASTARFPLQVTVVYLLLGGGYILLSDLLVGRFAGDAVQAAHLQTAKGWGFVLVTALVLFVLLRHRWRLLQAEITARRQAEQALLQLNSELEERIARRTAELAAAESADRIKSAFLATMSHELRTPLNSIIGFTGVLLQGLAGPVNEEQHKQLTIVQASGRHLLALINDVLDISRIEAGQMQFDLSTFDVRDALERVVRMVGPLAEHKGLALHWRRPAAQIRVTTDQRRLEQVFVNLLNNAVKFTEQGSVRIDCTAEGERVRVAFVDSGIGMPAEQLAHLGTPFYQLDNSLHRRYEGTGLGLSICRRLLDLMGGALEVASTPGEGSVFTVTLPAQTGKEP